ncbi:MAG: hypothetical protein JJ892_07280 [Balneola sp.]|nr:hypothetical protein [Balneola sp.]MBO6650933.1 hypothetical protein [Balneola sp.]MBO6711875.1 hypothetical protein [Balneola sp.]MBO6800070.1 hypothetical protein [Balneola sp.]MBO6871549.1 hypothetical protein [Balneola sp.]
MEPTFIILLVLSFIFSLVITPLTKIVARKIGAVDIPNIRKVHKKPTYRLGGVAIFCSTSITLFLCYYLFPEKFFSYTNNISSPGIIIISIGLILCVGIWDDVKALGPTSKFLVQIISAILISYAGINIPFNLPQLSFFDLGYFDNFASYLITIFWVVGVTNAYNLIDGLDGLASGIAAISLITVAFISLFFGQSGIALMSIILVGALLGFLVFNFRPASIFLGDSGSLFLGFMLSVFSIQSFELTSTTFTILAPVLILGLPIVDTFLSMARRFISWFLPEKISSNKAPDFRRILKSIFQPDKFHIHHQLMKLGFSHRNTVLILYGVSAVFSIGATGIILAQETSTILLLIFLLAVFAKTCIGYLKYREIDVIHNGIFYELYNQLLINRRYLRKVMDSIFIVVSIVLSTHLISLGKSEYFFTSSDNTILFFGFVLCTQLSLIWITGIYKETIKKLGIMDVMAISRSIAIAVAATAGVHYLFLSELVPFNGLIYLLDFYFLASLIIGARIAFHILKFLFHKSNTKNKNVLIYGTNEKALMAIQRLQNGSSENYTPIGFLDDDPDMEGMLINELPVFGGHWKLKRIAKLNEISNIIITDPYLQPVVLDRVYKIASALNINIQHFHISFKNIKTKSSNKSTSLELIDYVS